MKRISLAHLSLLVLSVALVLVSCSKTKDGATGPAGTTGPAGPIGAAGAALHHDLGAPPGATGAHTRELFRVGLDVEVVGNEDIAGFEDRDFEGTVREFAVGELGGARHGA